MASKVLKLGFWGVRGSTPTVDRANWRYGGNTPCLELLAPDGTRFVLDCGTGLRMLGNRWIDTYGTKPMEAHVIVTHYHWDHIQGIPFFSPLYSDQNRFHFYSFRSKYLGQDSLKQVLGTQMAYPYFPVDLSMLPATREFSEIAGGDQFEINGNHITARWLNHPQGCLGFRIATSAGIVVYATDNEPGVPELDESLRQLAAGADIFINDAQYTPEQLLTSRKGWGHSSWLEGVKVAQEVGVRTLVLFHHDPDSSDRIVDLRLRDARQKFESVWAAAEGLVLTLSEGRVEVAMRNTRTGQRRATYFPATVTGYSEDGCAFEEKTIVHDLSLLGAGLHLAHTPRLQSELKVRMQAPVSEDRPDGPIHMRGYVVRHQAMPEKHLTAVGILLTEEVDPRLVGE